MSLGVIKDDFNNNTNGWLIVSDTGAGDPMQPVWTSGMISFTPATGTSGLYFQAPTRYLGDRSLSYGYNFRFTLGYDIQPVNFKTAPLLIIRGGNNAGISLSLSTPAVTAANIYLLNALMDESAGWLSLPGNTPASAADIQAVLQNITQVLIRIDHINETFTTVSLSSVAMSYLNSPDLSITADIYYQDRKLYASWLPVPSAYQYTIKITDEAGADVYNGAVLASDFAPPVILGADSLTPLTGKTYTVVVTAAGPGSSPASVATVDIGKAVLAVQGSATGVTFTWSLLSGANTYDLQILDENNPATVLIYKQNITDSPVVLTATDGLELSTGYTGIVRGRTGKSFGDWSDPVPFTLNSARQILTDLQQRLNSNRPDVTSVIFNDMTFPAGIGNADAVLSQLKDAFDVDHLTITLTGSLDLSTDGLSLTLEGAAVLRGTTVDVNATFQVSDNLDLTMLLKAGLPDTWKISDTFPIMALALTDYLYLEESSIILSTGAYTGAPIFYPVQQGMNYIGTMLYTADLSAIPDTVSATVQRVRIGGPVTRNSNGVSFDFSGEASVVDLTALLTGLPALTLTGGQVSVTSHAAADGTNTAKAIFKGSVSIYGQTSAFNLDIPTRLNSKLELSLASGATLAVNSLANALTAVSGTAFNSYMPDSLTSLTGLSVGILSFKFDPSGATATTSAVTLALASGSTFDLIPSVISVGNMVFNMSVNYFPVPGQNPSVNYSATISGGFNLGGLAVNLSLFIPAQGDWILVITPQVAGSASLANIAGFTAMTDTGILATLPDFFQGLTSFAVDQIILTAVVVPSASMASNNTPFSPSITSVRFNLSQVAPWTIAANILSVSDWTLGMVLLKNNIGWDLSGVLNGSISLGGGSDAVTFNIDLPFPVSDSGWVLRLKDEGFDLPGLGKILDLTGAGNLTDLLPDGIRNIGNIHVSAFEIAVDPTNVSPVRSVFFQMSADNTQQWTLIADQGLVISNIKTGMTIVNDPVGVYVTGYISGDLTIAGTVVSVQATKMTRTAPWLLNMSTITVIHLPGISDLANWMLPTTVSQYLPASIVPFSNGLDMINAGLKFNLTDATLNEVNFVIINREVWNLLPGFISADNLLVDATIADPLASPGLTLHAEILLNMGPVGIVVKADKTAPAAALVFSGTLDQPVTIDFGAAFASMNLSFIMPYDYGFPRSMVLQTASATLNYTAANFNFEATSTFDWSFDLGVTTLKILAVNLAIDIDPRDAAGTHPYRLSAGGTFTLAGLQAVMNFTTSNIPVLDTVLSAVVTTDQLANISIGNMVDALTVTSGATHNWDTIAPAGYTPPLFASAYVQVNLSKDIFYLYGEATGLGGIAVIAKKIDAQNWGYALGLNLGADFKFAHIFSVLSVIDDYLKVNSAGLFIVSYAGSTTTLVQDLSTIDQLPGQPSGTLPVLPLANLPAIPMTSGMMFYGDLNITTSALFNKIVQIGAQGTARIIIYGFINHTDPAQTTFTADLPDIVLFDTLKFTHQDSYSGIHLTYSPGNNAQFDLATRLVVSLFDKDYAFDGNLTVNNTSLAANLTLVTGTPNQQIVNPFGVPGLTIGALSATVNYTFGQDAVPATGTKPAVNATQTTSSFGISGDALIGPAPAAGNPGSRLSCTFSLALLQSKPVLARVQLSADFSVMDFFAQFITGSGASWPVGLINITFLNGSTIYYYDAAADSAQLLLHNGDYTYRDGLNMDATIRLTLIADIDIPFTLQVIADGPATAGGTNSYKGVRATGSVLTDPINLYILEIAGTSTDANGNYSGGPMFKLDTTTSPNPSMGFSAGFNFLKKPFGTADLSVTKDTAGELLLTGTLASAVSFDPFGVLSLGFTYNATNGLQISNWPDFDFAREAIDFVSTLQQLAASAPGGGACSKLADFLVAQAYSTKFSISPSFLTESGAMSISISGTYELFVLGNSFLTADFPNVIKIPLPNSLSLDDLPEAIFNALAGASASFVSALMSNTEAISKFMVIVAGQNAAKYAADLVCNGLADAAATAAAAAGAAALAGIAGGLAAAGAIATIGAAILGSITSCFTAGTEILMADQSIKNIEDVVIGDQLAGANGVFNTVSAFDRPQLGGRMLFAINEGRYFVTSEHPFMTTNGWRSIDPVATLKENSNLAVGKLTIGDQLLLSNGQGVNVDSIRSTQADPATQLYNFKLDGNNTYYADGYLVHNKGGSSCFVADTIVIMSDGSEKAIQDILIGDSLVGQDGELNEVLAYDAPLLGERLLYAFNEGPFFVTEEHPFLTEEGWKSLNPAATARENPALVVTQLAIGDLLILAGGKREPLDVIRSMEADPATQLYNFKLLGNNTYYAGGYLAHNKGGSSCFVAGTIVVMGDGSEKAIQDILIGDSLIGQDGTLNKVLAYDAPLLGERLLYAFNQGPFFVTEEHPFLTEDGWKSLSPAATARENPALSVTQLGTGDILILADGKRKRLDSIRSTQADRATQLYNFILEGNNTYYADGYLVHNKGGSCFVADTIVIMSDGSEKVIQDILIGDSLIGQDGELNEVLAYDAPLLGDRLLYAFNNGPFFVTEEHPFLTEDGWKSLNPAATARENPALSVAQLGTGDILILADGKRECLDSIRSMEADSATQLYNFKLEGNNTYYADGYLVHNKDSCFVADTIVIMSDGSEKVIQDILIGDSLIGQDGELNEVLAYDAPLLGERLLYAFNDGPFFVTEEHPFLTEDGWKSLNPVATARENPALVVSQLSIGDLLILAGGKRERLDSIRSTQADPSTQLYNFKLEGNNTYYADGYLVHNKDSCFVADTIVVMGDGSEKAIQDILIGDSLIGQDGELNEVIAYDAPLLGDRLLYAFNDGPFFVTEEHPFLTEDGWKSLSPAATARENPALSVAQLGTGDILILADGKRECLDSIRSMEADPATQLYNFKLEGNNTYYADGYLVHNKGGSCFVADTIVIMSDGSEKVIQDILVGDSLVGQDGELNEVLSYDSPLLGERLLYAFNDGPFFVTEEHPFLTEDGWKSLNPVATARENPVLVVSQLAIGDLLILASGERERLESIRSTQADPSTQLYNFKLEGNNTYYADGYLVHNKGGGSPNNPAAPDFDTVTYSQGILTVTWDAASYADKYDFQFLKPDGSLLGTLHTVLYSNQLSLTVDLSDESLPAGSYQAQLRSGSGTFSSAWNNYAVTKPAAPSNVTLSYSSADEKLLVAWDAVGTQSAYTVILLLNDAENSIQPSDQLNLSFDAGTLAAGSYSAKIQTAIVDGSDNYYIPGDYGLAQTALVKPPTPLKPTISAAGEQINVAWDQGNQPALWQIDLLKNSQVVQSDEKSANMTSFDASAYDAGTYTAQIRVKGDSTHLPSDPIASDQSVAKPDMPQNVGFTYDASVGFTISWNAVTGNQGYKVRIVDHQTKTIVAGTADAAKDSLNTILPLTGFTGNAEAYIAQVKVVGDATTLDSTYADSAASIAAVPATQVTGFTYDAANGFIISWNAVTGNKGYKVQIIDQQTKTIVAAVADAAKDSVTLAIPLTGFTGNAEAYIAQVKTMGAAGIVDSGFADSTVSVSAEPAPQVTGFVYDTGTGFTVNWSAVSGNNGYQVQIVDQQTKTVVAATADAAKDSLTCIIAMTEFTGTADAYIAQVRTKANTGILDSPFADSAITVTAEAAPQVTSFIYDNAAASFTISWNAVTGNNGYKLQIVDLQTKTIVALTAEALKDSRTLNVPLDGFTGTADAYVVQVKTLGAAGVLDSTYAVSSASVTTVSAPQVTGFSYDAATGFTINWDTVTGNNGYKVRIVDERTKTIVAASADAAKDALTTTIPLTGFTGDASAYLAQVSTIGVVGVLNSVFADSSASVSAEPVPQVSSFIYDAATGFTINWTAVAGNNGYRVRIVDGQTKAILATSPDVVKDALNATIPFTTLTGNAPAYTAQVSTIGTAGVLNSAFTDSPAAIAAAPVPQVNGFVYNNSAKLLMISWSAVPGNNGYQVQIVDEQTKTFVAATANASQDSLTLAIPLTAFTGGAQAYIAQVKTIGELGVPDSAFADSAASVSTQAAPQVTGFVYNAVLGFTINWDTVTGNNGYQVRIVDQHSQAIVAATGVAVKDSVTLDIGLAGFTGGADAYIAQVSTTGDEGTLDSSFSSSVASVDSEAAPQVTGFVYDNAAAAFTITWNAVTGNNGYLVQIVDQLNRLVLAAANAVKDSLTLSIPLTSFTSHADGYIAQVKTIGGTQTPDSGFADSSKCIITIAIPQVTSFRYDHTSAAFVVNWTPVAGNNGYQIRFLCMGIHPQTFTVSAPKDSITLEHQLNGLIDYVNTYQVQVSAVGASGVPDSNFVDCAERIPVLFGPKNITLAYAATISNDPNSGVSGSGRPVDCDNINGQFIVYWENVVENNGYVVEIRNFATPPVTLATATATKDVTCVFIPLSTISPSLLTLGNAMIPMVKTTGSDQFMDSDFVNSATTLVFDQLPAPDGFTFSYDSTTRQYVTAWNALPGASAFTVNIVSEHTPSDLLVTVSVAGDATGTTIPAAAFIQGGSYLAQVQATSINRKNSVIRTSDNSLSPPAAMITASVDLVYLDETISFDISWNAVPNNDGYQVQIIDQQTRSIVVATVNAAKDTITLNIPLTALTGNAAGYVARVRTLGGTGILDSGFAYSANSVGLRPAPVVTAINYDTVTGAFTINWNPVRGNNGYEIRIVDQQTRSIVAATAHANKDSVKATIPISGFSGGTGTYLAQVKTVGDARIMDLSFSDSANTVARLAAPQNATLTYADGNHPNGVSGVGVLVDCDNINGEFIVNWVNVAGNNGYVVKFRDVNTAAFILNTLTVARDQTSLKIPLNTISASLLHPRIAMIPSVMAIGTGSSFDSEFSDSSASALLFNQVPCPDGFTFIFDAAKGQYIMNWNAVSGADGFVLNILAQQSPSGVVATVKAAADATSAVISAFSFFSEGGNFIAQIQAVSTVNKSSLVRTSGNHLSPFDVQVSGAVNVSGVAGYGGSTCYELDKNYKSLLLNGSMPGTGSISFYIDVPVWNPNAACGEPGDKNTCVWTKINGQENVSLRVSNYKVPAPYRHLVGPISLGPGNFSLDISSGEGDGCGWPADTLPCLLSGITVSLDNMIMDS